MHANQQQKIGTRIHVEDLPNFLIRHYSALDVRLPVGLIPETTLSIAIFLNSF